MFYWVMKHVVLGPITRLVYRPWTEGLENVPTDGPVLLCANHNSFLDSIFMPLVVPRQVVFLGKSDYFDKWYMSWFFKAAGVIPVRREGGEAGEASLRAGIQALRDGHAVGIYPEGTRSPDGRLYRGKTGAARMALRAGCPIVPVAIIGSREAQPPDRMMPRRARIGVRFGRPIDVSRYEGKEDDRFVLRSVTDELMYEIMMLSGQEYVDEYASKYKKQNEAGRPPGSGEQQPPLRAAG
ncbi:MAG: lysophospholipid acyltransferase family protein [Actinomycetota bacterium]